MPRIVAANKDSIAEAAAMLRAGEIIVLPTETVYGLGASALDNMAVTKIFEAKKRPSFNPLIVHVLDKNAACALVDMDARAHKVADAFWPGAVTLILPRKIDAGLSDIVSAGLPTLAVRAPSHKVMRAVIKAAGVPIAAPSANSSGEPSATTPHHAAQSLGEAVSYILAAGACDVGLESTVLDLSGEVPVILRPGAITPEDLEPYIGRVEIDSGIKDASKSPIKSLIKSPGQLLKHYAPKIPVRLDAVDVDEGEALLAFGSIKFMGIKSSGAVQNMPDEIFRNLSEEADLNEAAKNLFMMLRDLDKPSCKGIAVMNIPKTGIGVAINERLSRAAKK